MLFVKRDLITLYKQTILGPLWYLVQPLFTSVIFTLVFNNVAGIQTGGIPPFLFNLAGITTWNYFKECLTATSDTFKKNEQIFGKVYFPKIRKRQDYGLWLKILKIQKYAFGLPIVLAHYRDRSNSKSNNKLEMVRWNWNLYKNVENLSFITSIYLMIVWAYRGFKKYS